MARDKAKGSGGEGKGVDPRRPATAQSRDQRKRPKKEAANCPPARNRRRKQVRQGRTFRRFVINWEAVVCPFFQRGVFTFSFVFLTKQPMFNVYVCSMECKTLCIVIHVVQPYASRIKRFVKGALFLFGVYTLLTSLLIPCDHRLYGFPLSKAIGSIALGKRKKLNPRPLQYRQLNTGWQ